MYHKELLKLEYELVNHPILSSRTTIKKIKTLLELELFSSWQPFTAQDFPPNSLNYVFEVQLRSQYLNKIKSVQRRMDAILLPNSERQSYRNLLIQSIKKHNVKVSNYEEAMSCVKKGFILELFKNTNIEEEIVRLMVLKQTAIASNKDYIIAAALNYNRIALLPYNFLKELSKSQHEDSTNICSSKYEGEEFSNGEFRLSDYMDKPSYYPETRSIEVMSHFCREDCNKWAESQLIGKLMLETKLNIFDLAYKKLNRKSRSKKRQKKLDKV